MLYSEPAGKPDQALFPKIAKGSNYDWVSCSNVKRYFEMESTGEVKRYFPEPHTGTRAAFEAACGATSWPHAGEESDSPRQDPEDYRGPFVNLVSVPFSRTTQQAAPCGKIGGRIKVAVVCRQECKSSATEACRESCKSPAESELVVVMKLTDLGHEHYRLSNSVECNIARILTSSITEKCELDQQIQVPITSHIARIQANPPLPILEYEKCK